MKTEKAVSIKGTRHGLIINIHEDEELEPALEYLDGLIADKKDFFKGASVSFNLGWRDINNEELQKFKSFCELNEFTLQGVISSSIITRKIAESNNVKAVIGRLGIAEHGSGALSKLRSAVKQEKIPFHPPEEHTKIVKKTLRSGQDEHSQGNLLLLGDLNPGAQITAGGDVYILGALRGRVHAGLGGKPDSLVFALLMEPAQLRIGEIIATLPNEKKSRGSQLSPVVAKLENQRIVVTPYFQKLR